MLVRLAAMLCVPALLAVPASRQWVDLVDPFIDTHRSRWIHFSSACRPFGMVNLSPDTKVDGDLGAGYLYNEKFVRTISHIHDWQLAGVPVLPTVGPVKGHEGYEAYKSSFSHTGEIAGAGYHKLRLDDYGVDVELTSTARVGFHRYRFPATDQANILFDTGAPLAMLKMQDASIRRVSDRELAGYSVMSPTMRRPKSSTVYFVVRLDRPIDEFGGWEADAGGRKTVRAPLDKASGPNSGAYVRFRFAHPATVLMKVALSYVSESNARLNLETELPGWNFDAIVRESRNEWNDLLGKIAVEGGSESQRRKFYTDLWHALLGRRTYNDVDGSYLDNTGDNPVVRKLPLEGSGRPARRMFNSDAFWGTHWNLNVLWSIAYPRLMSEMVSMLVDFYKNGGLIARGPTGGNYTFVMTGDPSTPLIAAAYNKGIRDFDVEAAYSGCRKNAFVGGIRDRAGYEFGPNPQGGGMNFYVERGYVPLGVQGSGIHKSGAGQTMEYAYQDWALSEFAKALGKTADSVAFAKRSANWRNLFDPETKWIRPRQMDGSWLPDFKPVCGSADCQGFVESNSAIYSYYVPHDLPGLIDAVGGKQAFITRLNEQFEKAAAHRFLGPRTKNADKWVDYSNQPGCQLAHLFTHAGSPSFTQYWVRRVKEEAFGDTTPYGGYNGDEDQGQMGALGVLMAIGLFDVQGGAAVSPRYELTSPVFDRITIHLDGRYYRGKTFTIVTKNNEPGNVYIQSVSLNGKPLQKRLWITHEEATRGGVLEVSLGAKPISKKFNP